MKAGFDCPFDIGRTDGQRWCQMAARSPIPSSVHFEAFHKSLPMSDRIKSASFFGGGTEWTLDLKAVNRDRAERSRERGGQTTGRTEMRESGQRGIAGKNTISEESGLMGLVWGEI